MPDVSFTPFGNGHGQRVEKDTIIFTFPQTTAMRGWKMSACEVDESGYFLQVTWSREPMRTVVFDGCEMTISIEEYDTLKTLTHDNPTQAQRYANELLDRENRDAPDPNQSGES